MERGGGGQSSDFVLGGGGRRSYACSTPPVSARKWGRDDRYHNGLPDDRLPPPSLLFLFPPAFYADRERFSLPPLPRPPPPPPPPLPPSPSVARELKMTNDVGGERKSGGLSAAPEGKDEWGRRKGDERRILKIARQKYAGVSDPDFLCGEMGQVRLFLSPTSSHHCRYAR